MNQVLVFDPSCVSTQPVDSFSNSWKKPQLFHALIQRYGVPEVNPQTNTPLYYLLKAHTPEHVDAVLNGIAPTGFGKPSKAAAQAASITVRMFVEGALLAADGASVCVPVSGFHHASHDRAEGFCTFNGLASAAAVLSEKGKSCFILDCDAHYGNGTDDILNHFIKLPKVSHWTYGGTDYADKKQGQNFLQDLPGILNKYGKAKDVILYQAGADPHIKDPLGGYLTTEQLRERDRIVFQWCKANNKPIVWNLAGGYQTPYSKVLALHEATYQEWLDLATADSN